jgi:hypothetical protein
MCSSAAKRSMTDPLQELLDRQRILEVLARYAFGMDLGRRDLFESIWTPDASLVCTALDLDARGRPAILDYYDSRPGSAPQIPAVGGSVRIAANPIIELHGDRASVLSELAAFRYSETGINPYAIGYYEDELTKSRGSWFLSRRTMVVNPLAASR